MKQWWGKISPNEKAAFIGLSGVLIAALIAGKFAIAAARIKQSPPISQIIASASAPAQADKKEITSIARSDNSVVSNSNSLSIEKIVRTFRDAPAIRHDSMKDFFVGQNVEWDLYLGMVKEDTEKNVFFLGCLPANPNMKEPLITFFLPIEGNEHFRLSVEGDILAVSARIKTADQFRVMLEDTKVTNIRKK